MTDKILTITVMVIDGDLSHCTSSGAVWTPSRSAFDDKVIIFGTWIWRGAIFVFSHYLSALNRSHLPKHYDSIAIPAAWLLIKQCKELSLHGNKKCFYSLGGYSEMGNKVPLFT